MVKCHIVSGIGFLVIGWWGDDVLRILGIDLNLGWWSVVLVGVGIGLIIWGAIPNRAKNWAEEWAKRNVQLILPDRVTTPKQLERELRWHRVKNKISKVIKFVSIVFSKLRLRRTQSGKKN